MNALLGTNLAGAVALGVSQIGLRWLNAFLVNVT